MIQQQNKISQPILDLISLKTRLPKDHIEKLKDLGWTILESSIERKHKGIYIVIEFCIGDFCVYPCSKNGHWLLEKKTRCKHIIEAFVASLEIESRINQGHHWQGEED